MAGQPGAGHGPGRPEIIELGSVPGFVVLDLPDAAVCAGGTRLAPDVTIAEVALLARAMTYKSAAPPPSCTAGGVTRPPRHSQPRSNRSTHPGTCHRDT